MTLPPPILDPAQDRARAELQNLVPHMSAPPARWPLSMFRKKPPGTGVYLYGPVGRGKTHVMDRFIHDDLPRNVRVERVHFHAFMLSVHAFLHAHRTDHANDILPRFARTLAARADLLCFDEFHVVDIADAMILARLMTALMDAGIHVVMTSNFAPHELYLGGLKRENFLPFIDLLNQRLKIVQVDHGTDYRLSRLRGQPVYFTPLGAASDAAMDHVYATLTDSTPPTPDSIDVLGRTLVIPAAHGVARVSFSDLCEKPLAAQDYLALVARYHTLMIDHVPKFTYDRRNEAKRFMILVDIWYEHRHRLFLSAAAPIEQIYIDGTHTFEFTRTLSRLQEMGSADYLGAT